MLKNSWGIRIEHFIPNYIRNDDLWKQAGKQANLVNLQQIIERRSISNDDHEALLADFAEQNRDKWFRYSLILH